MVSICGYEDKSDINCSGTVREVHIFIRLPITDATLQRNLRYIHVLQGRLTCLVWSMVLLEDLAFDK